MRTYAPLLSSHSAARFTHETLARAVDPPPRPLHARHCCAATRKPFYTRNPHAAAAPAGETHTYEADQDGDLNLQLTMVSFADAKAKKGETYVVYAAADDGTVARVYQTPWRNG